MQKRKGFSIVIGTIILALILNTKGAGTYGISYSITSGLMLGFGFVLAYNTYHHKGKTRAYVVAGFLILSGLVNMLGLS